MRSRNVSVLYAPKILRRMAHCEKIVGAEQYIKQRIGEQLGLAPATIEMRHHLVDDLALSIDQLRTLAVHFSTKFSKSVSVTDVKKCRTVAGIYRAMVRD